MGDAYMVFGVFVVVLLVCFWAKGMYDKGKAEKKLKERLYQGYGVYKERKYNPQQYNSIACYFQKHEKEGQIDDITWNDLSMDAVFQRINQTNSSAGEEYLYYRLRTPLQTKEELTFFDALCVELDEKEDLRVKTQLLLAKLGRTGKFSLYEYIEHLDLLGDRKNTKHYLVNLLLLAAFVLALFQPSYGLLLFVVLAAWNMISYFKEKAEVDSYITSFGYILRLLDGAEKIGKLPIETYKEQLQQLEVLRKSFHIFQRGSFWLMSTGRMSGSGNPLDIIFDYLRMTLHLDLIKFNSMLKEVRLHVEDIDAMVGIIGQLECAIAVGSYRKSLQGEWCQPQFIEEKQLEITDTYHPLLTQPVKNSISTKKGVLLTGSNASGKSTFLKTVALNGIMAQTIDTVTAASYLGPFFRICSSMSLRDDIGQGESYYIVEIKSIKRILDIAAKTDGLVLCFVDEVLRGTNTVERIAASTQILQSLGQGNVLCFAATHDIELTDLLEMDYNNYHFQEEVEEGDVRFDYKLLPEKATTRNAIKLLGIMGYESAIIAKAEQMAADFVKKGVWRKVE